MATPVPKPRTKFGEQQSPNHNQTPEPGVSPPESTFHLDDVVLRRPPEAEETVRPPPPAVPPRPPAKPPRALGNSTAVQKFGNVLGELKLNLGEGASAQKPPEIGWDPGVVDPNQSMSPPQRHAPPPPRPPPPAGWKPEVQEPKQPAIPERISSNSNRPLPALPIEVDLTPANSGPSTSSSYSQLYTNPQVVENPLYLSLDAYRSISGITPSPSNPPTTSPGCDEVREWLTEEEEAETCSSSRPENLNSNVPAPPSRPSIGSQEENPYTPCPRRSDYSSSEFVGSTLDPFDDSFYNSTASISSKNQNLYVLPDPLPNHTYVNVPPLYPAIDELSISETGEELCENGNSSRKMKIDGSSITFVGFVCLTHTKKEKRVHCRLRNMQLSFHEDEESTEACHGPYDIKDIYLFRQIQGNQDGPSTSAGATGTTASSILIHVGEKRHVLSFTPEDPSNLWMFFLSEAWLSLNYGLTAALRDADELSICGLAWIKHGATGEWKCCSAGINNLTLHYMLADARDRMFKRNSRDTETGASIGTTIGSSIGDELVEVDLRKVMTMRDRIDKSEYCPNVKHKRGPFSITLHGVTLYIDSRDDTTTTHWYEAIDSLLKKPATRLENLRLTGDNIPVIVDKCIRFVSAYGMKSEGIYRRNGKVTEAKTILTKLTEVQENDETVYAVADVLRQFFRRLDEPLFPSSVQADLFELALESQSQDLYKRYAELIEQFPIVHHATLKKLIGHLKNVSEHAQENRASVENLAKVFAASLFMTDAMDEKVFSESYNHQINAMIHLITGYDTIFQISIEEELSRQMVNDAEKKSLIAKKPSPDLIVPIHVWEKENRPFNVQMSLASGEVCREAIAKRGFDGPPDSPYAVFECLADGYLVRRLCTSQKMSKCVLQWIDWNCKDAYLLFDHDKHKFDGSEMSCFTGKVKVAEPGSKTFKSYEVKVENGTSISAYRNEKLWKSWPMDEIIWYVGSEPSRKAPNSYNTTMIRTAKDGYSNRFPGFCFSFKEDADRSRWLTALSHFSRSVDSEPLVYI
uniref:Rho-GAP domain-containing protein n=1 Tax=Caenorhabditis tropicalis TaxID=1561998 RepID=A0A1I7UJW7_9PELO